MVHFPLYANYPTSPPLCDFVEHLINDFYVNFQALKYPLFLGRLLRKK